MHFEVYCIIFLYLWLFVSVIIQIFCVFEKKPQLFLLEYIFTLSL